MPCPDELESHCRNMLNYSSMPEEGEPSLGKGVFLVQNDDSVLWNVIWRMMGIYLDSVIKAQDSSLTKKVQFYVNIRFNKSFYVTQMLLLDLASG